MSALGKEIADAVDQGLFGGIPGHSFKVYQPTQQLNAIAAADAAIAPLVEALADVVRALDVSRGDAEVFPDFEAWETAARAFLARAGDA